MNLHTISKFQFHTSAFSEKLSASEYEIKNVRCKQ